jgi:hypothetical protein
MYGLQALCDVGRLQHELKPCELGDGCYSCHLVTFGLDHKFHRLEGGKGS